MNSTVVDVEVQEFLTVVRAQLADLDPDEQREILDGLEADLADLVAERGGGALGDPVTYARELRAAAGLAPEMGRSRQLDLSAGVHSFVDDAHALFDRSVAALPGDAAGVLSALQPAWWVLRAWIAVEVAMLFLGRSSVQVIPGEGVPGGIAVLAAVVLSVQLGRGRLWPHERWRAGAGPRMLLVALNVFAVLMVPFVADGLGHARTGGWERAFERGYQQGARDIRVSTAGAGVTVKGRPLSNIYPYDAKGRPLVGVQLFDQDGQPIDLSAEPRYDVDDTGDGRPRVYYPWTSGATQLLNVFPLASRIQDSKRPSATAFTEARPPAIPPFPLAQVPGVSLPGVKTGRQPVPVTPATPGG